MILTLNLRFKKIICCLVIFAFLFSLNLYMASTNRAVVSNSSPSPNFCVVLDAGHGGVDSGCIGISTGANERDINLSITQKLGKILSALDIRVVYTRTNMEGLYGSFASGFKKRDMQARCNIIKKANPNLVVSIHLNSYTSPTASGAQVFYKIGSDISRELGQSLQDIFVDKIEGSRKASMPGDFYMLNCTSTPGILVECGFLSNPVEEQKLVTTEYQEQLAYTIACGVITFFGLK